MRPALERARFLGTDATEHPSIFGAVPHEGRARRLRKRTLIALSRAIEDQAMASAARPLVLGAFQRERHYRGVAHRWERMAAMADVAVVFADFGKRADGPPIEVPITADTTIGHEWAVVVDAPGFAACLAAWEPPVASPPADERDRVFEAFWTIDADAVRTAARRVPPARGRPRRTSPRRIEALLLDRPQAGEGRRAALEALTARMVGYLESA